MFFQKRRVRRRVEEKQTLQLVSSCTQMLSLVIERVYREPNSTIETAESAEIRTRIGELEKAVFGEDKIASDPKLFGRPLK